MLYEGVSKSLPGSLRRLGHYVGNRWCTVTVYITSGEMASGNAGDNWPRVDRSGVSFCYVTLESPAMVELDTSVVPDMLGLKKLYGNAEPTRVLSGRQEQCPCARTRRQSDARRVP